MIAASSALARLTAFHIAEHLAAIAHDDDTPTLLLQLTTLGHDVRLIPAQYVKPFLKGHKNDYRDAEAIAEAVQ